MTRPAFDVAALRDTPIAFLTVTYLSVVLRLYSRVAIKKNYGWDDTLVIIAQLSFTLWCGALLFISRLTGDAIGFRDITQPHAVATAMLVGECSYISTMMFLKLSVGIFFLRLLTMRWQRIFIFVTLGTYSSFAIGFFFFAIFQCGVWPDIPVFVERMLRNNCHPKTLVLGMNYTHAVLNALTDWMCGILPLFFIKRSQIIMREKWGALVLLSLAIFGSVASIVRITYIQGIAESYNELFDECRNLAIWSTIEPGSGITATSMATLRPLVARWMDGAKKRRLTKASIAAADEENAPSDDAGIESKKEDKIPNRRRKTNASLGGETLQGMEFSHPFGENMDGATGAGTHGMDENSEGGREEESDDEMEMQIIQRSLRGRSIYPGYLGSLSEDPCPPKTV